MEDITSIFNVEGLGEIFIAYVPITNSCSLKHIDHFHRNHTPHHTLACYLLHSEDEIIVDFAVGSCLSRFSDCLAT